MPQEVLIFKPAGHNITEEKLVAILDYEGDGLEYELLPLLHTDQEIDITNVFGKEPYEGHIPKLRDMARRTPPPCKVFYVKSTNGYDLNRLASFLEDRLENFQCYVYWLTPNNSAE